MDTVESALNNLSIGRAFFLFNKSEIVPSLLTAFNDTKQALSLGIELLVNTEDILDLARFYMYFGIWQKYLSTLHILVEKDNNGPALKNLEYQNESIKWFEKSMNAMNNDRSLNPKLWDEIRWELFSASSDVVSNSKRITYTLSDTVTNDNERDLIRFLLRSLSYCDLENDTPHLEIYKYRVADIHEMLAEVYFSRIRMGMPMSEQRRKITIKECISHLNQSYEMYIKINHPLKSLNVINHMISLDEQRLNGTTSTPNKIKIFTSIENTLRKCIPTLQPLITEMDNAEENSTTNDSIKNETILSLMKEIQGILKKVIKAVMNTNSRLLGPLKLVYGKSLKIPDKELKISDLLQIITEIIEIIK